MNEITTIVRADLDFEIGNADPDYGFDPTYMDMLVRIVDMIDAGASVEVAIRDAKKEAESMNDSQAKIGYSEAIDHVTHLYRDAVSEVGEES